MKSNIRQMAGLAIAVLVVATGCTIRDDPAPRIIAEADRPDFAGVATGDAAEGGGRIYLLGPEVPDTPSQLRAVSRPDAADPEDLFESLKLGPNEGENALGLSSAIPSDLEILNARTVGSRLTIDINDALDELSDRGLRDALGQIVATATAIDQVQLVRLTVDGENRVWPTGDGEGTSEPLSIYDYPNLLESSQPDYPTPPPGGRSGEEV